jgi:hypothetical protein
MAAVSFWQNPFGRVLRWIAFLPVGVVLASVLQSIPPLVVVFAASWRPQFSFLILILGLIVLSVLGTLAWFWVMASFFTPVLACRVIAPNHRVAAVVFATLSVLCEGSFILRLVGDTPWLLVIYHIVFTIILVAGCVMAYKEET